MGVSERGGVQLRRGFIPVFTGMKVKGGQGGVADVFGVSRWDGVIEELLNPLIPRFP